MSLDEIVFQSEGKLFNNAAQVWNHNFFWQCLAPKGRSEPREQLAIVIDRNFGSFDQFKRKFTEVALDLFGSGWVWLVEKGKGTLSIEPLAGAGNPLTKDWKPVLVCDVWEHAYYVDYRNDRSKFLEAYWGLVNWEFAGKQIR